MQRRYFDYAATTPLDSEVLNEMLPHMKENFGNPSSVYSYGRDARKVIDDSREKVASIIGAQAKEIYFTSGGTESDNWAIKGTAFANKDKGNHIITTTVEHHAVLHTCKYLEKHGYEVTYLPVDEYGLIDLDDLKNSIRENTILITVMFANNEIGTIQPIAEIGKIAKENKVLFHTDAVQALGSVDIDVKDLGVDLMSISGHKIYGPKGIGALYVRKGVKIDNLIHGGAQEKKKRGGTENTPAIAGFAKACEMAQSTLTDQIKQATELRDYMIKGILDSIPEVKLNGHPEKRLPGNVNVSIRYIEGESILLSLDLIGIAASSGSACTSGSLDPSHVLLAIGLSHEIAHGSLRFSIGKYTTKEEVDFVLDKLPGIIQRLRDMSPLYNA
ncbi:cysteine desulfurase NifS [Alkalibacter saccharofermentans]|uniref:Cysteine desulfurase IscS n=1 Tax=Alkalibacter saccharofermentans DSM 14828 TaxID=1120975 RepID=A0A1M4XRP0_9FIRM|nr:cysteine desulfurase NifS [Alkalibacter saccharofermentans]SHE96159.1 cysteine desulfurase [Alkalibacter saccharofermentans DSM 14828]